MRTLAAVASTLLVLSVAGCNNDPADAPKPTPTSTSTTPSPTSKAPESSAELTVSPGAIGDAKVGMTVDVALNTGLFDADVPDEGCVGVTPPLTWKKKFKGIDVFVNKDKKISAMGVVSRDGPRTADDLGVGSTVGELIEVYGGQLKPQEGIGYDQVGMFAQEGDAWIGFLIGDAKKITDTDNDPGLEVTMVEVSKGARPDLMRDGC